MKIISRLLLILSITALSPWSQAVRIINSDSPGFESVRFELLHNPETGKGSIIVYPNECEQCDPTTLTYHKPFRFSIDGRPAVLEASTPKRGMGDLGYDQELMILKNLNMYSNNQ